MTSPNSSFSSPGFSNSGAGGYGSLNGTRANQINWQIDGIDNNDLWHNIPAVNQGGVSGIAGIVLPIDAVDQFSAQTQAAPESGRNPGRQRQSLAQVRDQPLHGSAYYYNRNEFFGATNPFTAPVKQEVRNYNYGFSAGGPIDQGQAVLVYNLRASAVHNRRSRSATEPSLRRRGRQAALKAHLANSACR